MNKTEHGLECSTKAKREALVKQVQAIADKYGATITASSSRPREIYIEVNLAPFHVSMTFDGECNIGAFIGHWYTDGAARFPVSFSIDCGGPVNTYHFGKATTCEDTFEDFLARLDAGLARLARNTWQGN
jgi:hypothetical protein